MDRPKVIVRAILDGSTIPRTEDETQYTFKKGEIGILSWKWHEEDPAYLQPIVEWDNAPSRQQRYTSFSALDMCGLVYSGVRFCVDSGQAHH